MAEENQRALLWVFQPAPASPKEQQTQKQANAYRILLFNLNHVVLKLLEKSRVRETKGALASAIQNRQSFFFS